VNPPSAFWSTHLAVLALGAALSLAFAPFGLWPLAILAPAVLFWLWQGVTAARAAALGFAFGCGIFASGTYWLFISINGFGKAPIWLALGLMAVLVVVMALHYALLGYLANRLMPSRGAARWLVGLPAGWVLFEWVRGWFLSGFGWLSLGYSQTDSWLAGWAPIGGVYVASLLLSMMAGALVMWCIDGYRAWRIVLSVVALPWITGYFLMRIEWTHAAGEPIDVAIVQGAIPQDQKWLADNRDESLRRYRDLTFSALGTPLIVWPEAAVPDLANNIMAYLSELADVARQRGSSLLVGLIRAEPDEPNARGESQTQYFNSILSLGEEFAWYNKHHLVPFGEFFPVPETVRRWMRLKNLPYSDFSRGAAHQPPLRIARLSLSASICYEDAYASSQIVSARESTALVNVTNDAWFGRSTARHQHLQISRMRAIEAQRFLIRAANDGISVVIGPRGEFIGRAPDFEPAVLRATITPRSGVPPYLRFGNQPVLWLVALGLLTALWAGRRRAVVT